ncbi:MAG: hypothetical protein OXF98_12075 [Rhodospirillaceae bacterium]|nr:hypothetical protein [Rhodospirillaceae bacterium]
MPRLGGARCAVRCDAHEDVTAVLPVGASESCNWRVVLDRKDVQGGNEPRSRCGRPHLRGHEELKEVADGPLAVSAAASRAGHADLPSTEDLQFFAHAHVEVATGIMTVELKNLDNQVLPSVKLVPAAA